MQKNVLKKKVIKTRKVVKLICDKCGKETTPLDDITTIVIDFGYGSKYDGDSLEFELCDDCIDKLKNEFLNNFNF